MRVMHVLGCKPNTQPNSAVLEQIKSLGKLCDSDLFVYKTGGLAMYVMAVFKFLFKVDVDKCDVIHVHFSRSFLVCMLCRKPTVVSFMGTDVIGNSLINKIIYKIINYFKVHKIYKSQKMVLKKDSYVHIVPNGVDFDKFFPMEKSLAREKLNLNNDITYILFLSNPNRPEKNYEIAKKSFEIFQNSHKGKCQLLVIFNISHELIPYYINSSDVLLLTSEYEGSPNVIKEALACNVPIVSTDVGDVKEMLFGINGCYVGDLNPEILAGFLQKAVRVSKTDGRRRIRHLEIGNVADRIYDIYKKALSA